MLVAILITVAVVIFVLSPTWLSSLSLKHWLSQRHDDRMELAAAEADVFEEFPSGGLPDPPARNRRLR